MVENPIAPQSLQLVQLNDAGDAKQAEEEPKAVAQQALTRAAARAPCTFSRRCASALAGQALPVGGALPGEPGVQVCRIIDPDHPVCGAFGLYALRGFRAGEAVCTYTGKFSLAAENLTGDCLLSVGAWGQPAGPRLVVDGGGGVGSERGLGSYGNDFRGVAAAPNAEYQTDHAACCILMVATRSIRAGEEVLTDYSASYWEVTRAHTTRRRHRNMCLCYWTRAVVLVCVMVVMAVLVTKSP
jgi:hypothetical protein